MAERAAAMGLTQDEEQRILIWRKDQKEQSRWFFVEDPSQTDAVRAVFNSDENAKSPACFVVVKQNDPGDDRGEVIFDVFRLNPNSYLWHFYRVYTPPIGQAGEPDAAPKPRSTAALREASKNMNPKPESESPADSSGR